MVYRTQDGVNLPLDSLGRAFVEAVLEENLSLRRYNTHDDITGLLNRRGLLDGLEMLLGLLRQNDQYEHERDPALDAVTVLYMDLDGFKPANDLHGHATGDEVLKFVAGYLERMKRESDLAARIGGDEFVVVCPGAHSVDGSRIALRYEKGFDLEKIGLANLVNPVVIDQLGLSVGFATTELEIDPNDLLKAADKSMYVAKRRRTSDRTR